MARVVYVADRFDTFATKMVAPWNPSILEVISKPELTHLLPRW